MTKGFGFQERRPALPWSSVNNCTRWKISNMDTEKIIIEAIKTEAEKKYPRRLKQLAKKCGWERTKLWRILTGEQAARLPELVKLCAVLSLSLPELLKIAGA